MSTTPATPLTRRHLLKGLAMGSLTGLAPAGFAATASGADTAFGQSFAAFDGPLADPGAGFSGTLETADIPLRGRLPEGLRGTLYRNGPARFKLGSSRYRHWFDGDGMVQAFHLGQGQPSHRGVLLRTPKLLQEEAAGRHPACSAKHLGTALGSCGHGSCQCGLRHLGAKEKTHRAGLWLGQDRGVYPPGDGTRTQTGGSDLRADDGCLQPHAYAHAGANPCAESVRRGKCGKTRLKPMKSTSKRAGSSLCERVA